MKVKFELEADLTDEDDFEDFKYALENTIEEYTNSYDFILKQKK